MRIRSKIATQSSNHPTKLPLTSENYHITTHKNPIFSREISVINCCSRNSFSQLINSHNKVLFFCCWWNGGRVERGCVKHNKAVLRSTRLWKRVWMDVYFHSSQRNNFIKSLLAAPFIRRSIEMWWKNT